MGYGQTFKKEDLLDLYFVTYFEAV